MLLKVEHKKGYWKCQAWSECCMGNWGHPGVILFAAGLSKVVLHAISILLPGPAGRVCRAPCYLSDWGFHPPLHSKVSCGCGALHVHQANAATLECWGQTGEYIGLFDIDVHLGSALSAFNPEYLVQRNRPLARERDC